MVLDKIKWPTQDEEEDSDVSLEETCRITGFLRTFIEDGKLIFTLHYLKKSSINNLSNYLLIATAHSEDVTVQKP